MTVAVYCGEDWFARCGRLALAASYALLGRAADLDPWLGAFALALAVAGRPRAGPIAAGQGGVGAQSARLTVELGWL
jgi:hypothetical protein